MSTLAAFFTVCLLVVLVTPVLLWQIHRAWKAEQAELRAGFTPDPRWGTDTALHDQCALILSLPARCPHREQLKQRLNDEPVLRAAFGAIADGIDYDADLTAFADDLLREIRDEDDHTTNPTGDQP